MEFTKTKLNLAAVLVGLGIAISAAYSSVAYANELSDDRLIVNAPDSIAEPVRGSGVAPSPTKPKLLNQAESNYQAGRYVHAIEQFGMVAAMNNHPFAWLRIGNIWHRRGNAAMALDAYRKASDLSATSEQHRKLWSRAMMNMTLLGIDQARQAVIALGPAQKEKASVQWASEIRLRVQELQRALPGSVPVNIDQAPLVTAKTKRVSVKTKSRAKRHTKRKKRRGKAVARVQSD